MIEGELNPSRNGNGVIIYTVAVALALAALLFRFALDPWLGDSQQQVTVFGAVAVSAWLGGWKPGAITALLGFALINYFIIPPRGAFVLNQSAIASFVGGIFSSAFILWLAEAGRKARQTALGHAAQAEAQEEQHREILNTLTSALFMFDKEMRYQFANTAGLKLARREWSEMAGKSVLELFPDVGGSVEKWKEALKEQKPVTYEKFFSGQNSWFEVTALPRADRLLILVTDIGERKRAQEALERSEAMLSTAVEAGEMGAWEWDIKSNRVIWTDRLYQIHGLSKSDFAGTSEAFAKLVHPDDSARVQSAIEGSLRGDAPYTLIFRAIRPDGGVRWLQTAARLIKSNTGETERMVGITQDVTDKAQVVEALQASEERFRNLMDQAPMSIQLLDPAGKTLRVNHAWEELWGLSMEQLADYNVLEDPQLEEKGVMRYLRRAFAGESVEIPEIAYDPNETIPNRTRHKDPVRWVSAIAYPLKDTNGKVIEVALVHQDVTNRKLAEMALKESEHRFRLLAESMPQLVWTAAADGSVEYYNSQVASYAGARRNANGTWEWNTLVHPEDLDATRAEWESAVAEERPYTASHRLKMATGAYRWHLSRATPVRDAEGDVTKWFGTATDIEEQKRTQEKLAAMVEERTARLQETVRDLESFSYSIAHDMRAPLRSMSGYARIVLEDFGGQIPKEGVSFLERIVASAQRLDRLITDILSYSMLARGNLPIETVDADQLTREIIETYASLHEPNALVVIEGRLPTVQANPAALTQVISNLLVNAVKFVKPGHKPKVVISSEARGADRARIWFVDNGIGIPEWAQQQIFQIFHRLDTDDKFEGTGIGLSIVRKAMERMKGEVGVESDGVNGSRFWIELPRSVLE